MGWLKYLTRLRPDTAPSRAVSDFLSVADRGGCGPYGIFDANKEEQQIPPSRAWAVLKGHHDPAGPWHAALTHVGLTLLVNHPHFDHGCRPCARGAYPSPVLVAAYSAVFCGYEMATLARNWGRLSDSQRN